MAGFHAVHMAHGEGDMVDFTHMPDITHLSAFIRLQQSIPHFLDKNTKDCLHCNYFNRKKIQMNRALLRGRYVECLPPSNIFIFFLLTKSLKTPLRL